MPLEDFLMPAEQIRFQSNKNVHYAGKTYQVILTDKRILLYAKRGIMMKNDDIVTQRLDDMQGVKYQETGIIDKKGVIKLQTLRVEMDLVGPAAEIKALYQQMMQFM
jgi:hypothetical protein